MITFKKFSELKTQKEFDDYCDSLKKDTEKLEISNIKDNMIIVWLVFLIGLFMGAIIDKIL